MTATHLARIEAEGFTIIEDVLDHSELAEASRALATLHDDLAVEPAGNAFEGHRTRRVYNLLARGALWQRFAIDERVLPVVEGVLDRECLVSSLSSIAIGPGETAQMLHADDQVIGLPKPHPSLVCNTMWALTDFTAENGATRVVPGSHRADRSPDPTGDAEAEAGAIPAEMPAGSVLIWHGSLWHGGGANTTADETRIGIAMNYCAGFVRQQENQQLGIPREIAATFPLRLKRLIGYGTYRRLLGHIDKTDPVGLLGDDPALRTIWD